VSTTNNAYLSNFYLDYGLQFYTNIGKKFDISLGATFANKTTLNADISQVVRNPDSSILYQSTYPMSHFKLPVSLGAGLALTYNKRYTFLADYKHQGWSDVKNEEDASLILNTGGFRYSLQNSDRVSFGFEFSKKRTISMGQYNAIIETMFFQAGFYYDRSYLNVYDQQIKDIGGTLGIGVNSKRTPLGYTLSFQYGVKGVQSVQLIQERYANFTLSISYRDLWLTRGRKFF
jgi:hypothetical protein